MACTSCPHQVHILLPKVLSPLYNDYAAAFLGMHARKRGPDSFLISVLGGFVPIWCIGQDVEFDCISSWSLPFHLSFEFISLCLIIVNIVEMHFNFYRDQWSVLHNPKFPTIWIDNHDKIRYSLRFQCFCFTLSKTLCTSTMQVILNLYLKLSKLQWYIYFSSMFSHEQHSRDSISLEAALNCLYYNW